MIGQMLSNIDEALSHLIKGNWSNNIAFNKWIDKANLGFVIAMASLSLCNIQRC